MSDATESRWPARELRWRVPTTGDPILFKLGIAQVGLASVVAALIILLTAPGQWRGLALAGLIPLAIFVAYRRWLKHQRSLAGEDNLRLDDQGLVWRDRAGVECGFARESVTGFRIAREADTLRPVPALTLYLTGGFESQPIELHEPATPQAVRGLLVSQWQLAERPAAASLPVPIGQSRGVEDGNLAYDLAIDVYGECHDDYQEWHFEGTAKALSELFATVAEVAQLPQPPVGAKPLGRVMLLRRREAARLTLQRDRHTRIGDDAIAGTAETLAELSNLAATVLRELPAPPADHKFDFRLSRGNVWTFHLHIREP